MTEEWTLFELPSPIATSESVVAIIPVRKSKITEIFNGGTVHFEHLADEISYFLTHTDSVGNMENAYTDVAIECLKISLKQAISNMDVQRGFQLLRKASTLKQDEYIDHMTQFLVAIDNEDVDALVETEVLPAVLIAAAHTFHEGQPSKALRILEPYLEQISEHYELSDVLLKSFGSQKETPLDTIERLDTLRQVFQ
jgi:hypothetical protein